MRYYYLKDHLGSIRMTVDASGNPAGWDDYYPYGMQMTGRSYTSSADQRYKFIGKERDASTGLDYFGARYYDSFRGQWLEVDPLYSKYPGTSPYDYVLSNPIRLVDPDGSVTYMIDGVEVDQGLGQQLAEQYQQQTDFQNNNGNNNNKGSNGKYNNVHQGENLKNWGAGLTAVDIFSETQRFLFEYAGDIGKAGELYSGVLKGLGEFTGISVASIDTYQFFKHKTLGNFFKASVDIGMVAFDVDPIWLLGKGILDVTHLSDPIYNYIDRAGNHLDDYKKIPLFLDNMNYMKSAFNP